MNHDQTRSLLVGLLWLLAANNASGQTDFVQIVIDPSRGADATVSYQVLRDIGPWDDRNYQMTAADVRVIDAASLRHREPLPAFYQSMLLRANPNLHDPASRFPRSALNVYLQRYGGFVVDGQVYRGVEWTGDRYELIRQSAIKPHDVFSRFLSGEARVTTPNGAAESAISIKPTDQDIVIAGTNGPGSGQRMHYSTDGGATWNAAAALPLGGTCCDPTIAWSFDATLAYTSTLGNCGLSGCSIWVYRSSDNGQTWDDLPGTPRRDLTTGGSDKEYLHVDRFPTSPHRDNVYLTWHNGNIMQFARSTDQGDNWEPTIAFSSAAASQGIGSDITTDRSGNVYYIWPAFNSQTIKLRKSTDGGASFGPEIIIDTTAGSFDFPIPAMETREVFIYASVDADFTDGPFSDRIYAAWTDATAATGSNPTANHARVRVARSSDGGATWDVVTAHETSDANSVDRFNQWLSVDASGVVHLIFYDTSYDADRTTVDMSYTYSTDGAVTWSTPDRLTTQSSPNIGDTFEYGDYNGMDVSGDTALAIYTDNRDESGGSAESVDVYASGDFAQLGAGYSVDAAPDTFSVCKPDAIASTISLNAFGGFSDSVTLAAGALPSGVTNVVISPGSITPGETASLTADVLGGATNGLNTFDILGTSTSFNANTTLSITVADAIASSSLTAPADGATNVNIPADFSWTAAPQAETYRLEIDDDPAFGSIDTTIETADTSATVTGLASSTTYHWRVVAINGCGETATAAFSFTSSARVCQVANVPFDDSAAALDTISLGGSEAIAGLIVDVIADHTYIGDISATLSHGGTTVQLMDRPGVPATTFGCSGNNMDVSFSDAVANPVEDACVAGTDPALTGVVTPEEALAAFDGLGVGGDWTLELTDNAGGDSGTLDTWCLTISTAATPAVETLAATAITDSTGTLNATVNPNGETTTAEFQWGPTTAYGNTVALGDLGAGDTDVAVDADLSTLDCNTEYHYRIVAQSAAGTATGDDASFTTLACPGPAATTLAATGVSSFGATLNGEVNPNGEATSGFFDWGPTDSYGNTVDLGDLGSGTTGVDVMTDLSGLDCGAEYHFRVRAENGDGSATGDDATFMTSDCPLPNAMTLSATNIDTGSARLNGQITPNGLATNGFFDWGLTAAFGNTIDLGDLGAGNVAVDVLSDLAGLDCGVEYHFRVRAESSAGTANGDGATFMTSDCPAPTAISSGATSIDRESATLNGRINPNGLPTMGFFDWGTTTDYGQTESFGEIGSGLDVIDISAGLIGLSCSTNYHFRTRATSDGGETTGEDSMFTTAACLPPSVSTDDVSDITTTSAVLNATVDANGLSTTVVFDFGSDTNLDQTLAAQTLAPDAAGASVSLAIDDLSCGTTYFAAARASSDSGEQTGATVSFSTAACPAPLATTEAATETSLTGATLNGSINPQGSPTSVHFDWGPTSEYGNTVAVGTFDGEVEQSVATMVDGLDCGMTFHFRVRAENSGGEALGDDAVFGTFATIANGSGDTSHVDGFEGTCADLME